MKLRVCFSLLLFLVLSPYVFGQSPRQIVDSLLNSAQQENADETLAAIYGELGWTYAAINLDSAIYYGQLAVELSEKTGDQALLAQSYSDLGSGYLQKGQLNEASEVYLKSLEIREANRDSLGMAKVYNALGFIFQRKYESDSAITYFLKALPIFEKEGVLLNAATILNNIGVIYQNMSNYPKAIEFYERAAVMREAQKDFRNLIGSYANLGTTHKYLGNFDQAEEYFQKAIDLAIREDDPLNLAVSYRMYAFFLQEKGDMDRLEEVAQKGLEAARAVNALYEEATMEYALGVVENTKKNYKKAKEYLESAAEKFVSQGAEDDVFGPYLELITSFAALGDADSSRYYANLYQSTLRSKEEKAAKELTAELETKYQTALKDSQISEQHLQIRNKNFQLYGSLLMALVLGLVGYLLYKQQKLKNRQLEQEVELKEALAQIETQNKLQEQRLLIARDLHDNIGAQLTFIISSIENLKYFEPIKETLTPRYESIANFTKQTIRELRDTIWAMNSGAVTLEDLVGRVKNFIQQGKQSTDVKLEFVQEEGLDLSKKISSANSIQILRIVQEAVQNAVKYAEASQIQVIFSLSENRLQFQVIDNGKGFDLEMVKAGNGLGNMQKRADEIEAILSVKSETGQGTEISLLLSL